MSAYCLSRHSESYVLDYLLRRHNRFLAFALTMVCVPLAAILLSFALFVLGYKCLFYLSFVPVTVGVLMHALVEHFEDYWHLYKHCAHCPALEADNSKPTVAGR